MLGLIRAKRGLNLKGALEPGHIPAWGRSICLGLDSDGAETRERAENKSGSTLQLYTIYHPGKDTRKSCEHKARLAFTSTPFRWPILSEVAMSEFPWQMLE